MLEIIAQHLNEIDRGIKYHKFLHGNRNKKIVALTFDDGPHLAYTLKLLDILKQYNTKATFF